MLVAWRRPRETHYARDGDHHLAYQVVGDCGPTLVFVPPTNFPIDLLWDEPTVAGHLRHLASFSRLILTDLLGNGSSDRIGVENHPAVQSWSDGLVAVLDAVGADTASIFTMAGGALPALLLAASHPHRVGSLVLWSPYARYLRAPDHPCGLPEQLSAKYLDAIGEAVETGTIIDVWVPSWADDPANGDGGPAVSGSAARRGSSSVSLGCGYTPTFAPFSRVSRRPRLCWVDRVTET